MKQLYKIQVSGKAGCGKTTRANELFDEMSSKGLSCHLVDDGSIRAKYRGSNPDYVTIETVNDGRLLAVTKVQ